MGKNHKKEKDAWEAIFQQMTYKSKLCPGGVSERETTGAKDRTDNKIRPVTGGPQGDCEERLVHYEVDNLSCRKAPPPLWTSPTLIKAASSSVGQKEQEELKEEN